MIALLCGTCQSDMVPLQTDYYRVSETSYRAEYSVTCDNMHISTLPGEEHTLNVQSIEYRVIQYLIQETEKRNRFREDHFNRPGQ